jgi:hypothetical protein
VLKRAVVSVTARSPGDVVGIKITVMKRLYILYGLTCFLLISCFSNKNGSQSRGKNIHEDSLITTQRLLLKNYALYKCLLDKFPQDSLLNDGTLEGYLELGQYGNPAYETIDSFVKNEASQKYASKYKKTLYIMRCIDIYNSKSLDSLIKTLDNEMSQ